MIKIFLLIVLTQTIFCHGAVPGGFSVVSTTEYLSEDLKQKLDSIDDKIQQLQQQYTSQTVVKTKPRNCKEVQDRGFQKSDIYFIQPTTASEPFPAVCDMKTEGGGWTYILNRFNGSIDFNLDWKDYKEGFGNLAGEFWLGLEKIHLLTGHQFNELLVELVDWDNAASSARYNTFTIGNEEEGYSLKILEGFSGSAGDAFANEAGMKFTTKDKDQDLWVDGNCADFSKAAWWYRECKWAHLTGRYFQNNMSGKDYLQGIYWVTFRGNTHSMKQARMMVRPRINQSAVLQPAEKFN